MTERRMRLRAAFIITRDVMLLCLTLIVFALCHHVIPRKGSTLASITALNNAEAADTTTQATLDMPAEVVPADAQTADTAPAMTQTVRSAEEPAQRDGLLRAGTLLLHYSRRAAVQRHNLLWRGELT